MQIKRRANEKSYSLQEIRRINLERLGVAGVAVVGEEKIVQ